MIYSYNYIILFRKFVMQKRMDKLYFMKGMKIFLSYILYLLKHV